MKIANTNERFVKRFKNDPQRAMAEFCKTRFEYVDYSFYKDAREDSVIFADGWQRIFSEVKNVASESGVKFVQAHSPGGAGGELSDRATVRSIEICGLLCIPVTVIHSEVYGNISKEEYFDRSLAYYKKFLPYAERYGVNLLIENSCKANMGDNTYFIYGEDMREFLDFAAHPLLNAVWDTGHGNLTDKTQYENITALGKYLKALHIHDNLGYSDDHMLPLTGTVNFDDVMSALIDMKYDGYFTFEASNFLLNAGGWPNCRKECDRCDKLADPSLALDIAAADFMYETGKEMLSAYGLFEK